MNFYLYIYEALSKNIEREHQGFGMYFMNLGNNCRTLNFLYKYSDFGY